MEVHLTLKLVATGEMTQMDDEFEEFNITALIKTNSAIFAVLTIINRH